MMMSIQGLPQPVIAKVQGAAAAAGCQLVAQCDLAVAVDTAKFVTSGVTWGFFCSTPGVAIGRNLQRKHAMEMLLDRRADRRAASAWSGGWSTGSFAADAVGFRSASIGENIGFKAARHRRRRQARRSTCRWTWTCTRAYELAGEVIASSFAHAEGKEGMEAFIEKRPPPGK